MNIKNKPLIITLVVVGVLLFAVLCGVLISLVIPKESDILPPIEGVYSMSVNGESSQYTFKKDGMGKVEYVDDGELVTEQFSYVISGKMGSRIITITNSQTGEAKVHDYATGKDKNGEFIMINDVIYYKQ